MTLIRVPAGSGAPGDLRAIRLLIIPVFNMHDPSHQPRQLSIVMTFASPRLSRHDVLVTLPKMIGNVPSQQYGKDSLQAFDNMGMLELAVSDATNERVWFVKRATCGDVSLQFNALPRPVDADTPPGPRVDLREQFGGILGVGSSFLPLPPNRNSDAQYESTIEWDLGQSPYGTRTVCSFGEGTGPIRRKGSPSLLRDPVFGVGPLRRLVNNDKTPSGALFNVFCASEADPYRIFLRETPRGNGGTAFRRSFMFEYDKDILRLERFVFPVLAHEMVHNWPLLNKESDGSNDDLDTGDENWYSEDDAAARFGLRNKKYLLGELNSYLSGYYTNPVIKMTNEEATRRSWEEPNALRLRYSRGFTYLLKVGAQVWEKTAGRTSIDSIVYELLERKRRGKSHMLQDWLIIIERELGHTGVDEYHDMANGVLVVPPADFPPAKYKMKLVRQDQEVLEFVFSQDSINTRRIRGLKPGSRADQAGLKEGDKILESSFFIGKPATTLRR
ncbi:peptidase m61 domain containing protein [Grosmannia clavigera kw1407]|uniref:Peptidase m61 domain containing protein n=1 Tax=Grosmannia clavigera (strain kw1407 / UAMH 11150) TaxID=655863 RepID=F0XDY9_GROCL|nr:peptidase m61 domain containing protein [Grosmannia clavigera kw1407]EFX03769.1 peptidase m61 domain containing protein [Grosmannia clavigera kw1407]